MVIVRVIFAVGRLGLGSLGSGVVYRIFAGVSEVHIGVRLSRLSMFPLFRFWGGLWDLGDVFVAHMGSDDYHCRCFRVFGLWENLWELRECF